MVQPWKDISEGLLENSHGRTAIRTRGISGEMSERMPEEFHSALCTNYTEISEAIS